MRFSIFIVLSVLALALLVTGAAASPQPTAQNGTYSPNATATGTAPTTTPYSTITPTPAPTATGTARPTADDVLDDVDPENATVDDVRTVADWVRSEGAERGGRQADRARDWLSNATVNRNITLPNISLGGDSTPTAAPTATPTPTPGPVQDAPDAENETGTRIDSGTVILSSEFDPNREMTSIVIKSERPQTVTISDAGHFGLGGEVPAREVRMEAGDQMRLEIASMKTNGDVALSISTRETPIYAHFIERGGGGLDILKALTTLQAWGAGLLVAFVWMLIGAYSVLREEDGSPRRATI